MRSPDEKKTKVTSIRMTEEQHQRVQKQADSHGMTVSNYIITTAVHGENHITPKMMVQLQNITNMATDAVQEFAPETINKMQKEVDKLWMLLK